MKPFKKKKSGAISNQEPVLGFLGWALLVFIIFCLFMAINDYKKKGANSTSTFEYPVKETFVKKQQLKTVEL